MNNPQLALDVWSSPSQVRSRLELLWDSFITGNSLSSDLRPLVVQSWERCHAQGVHPTQAKALITLQPDSIEDYFANNALYVDVLPILQKLEETAIDSGHLVVFCDERSNILRIDGDSTLLSKAEAMNFVSGSSWAEHSAGTNAIGTALESGAPIQVFAAEHYCQEVHRWTCSAAPIRDPATNHVLGVIDLTGLWETFHPISLPLVIAAARSVEERLRNKLEIERFKVLEYYWERVSYNPNIPIVAIDRGGTVIKASPFMYEHGWIDKNDRLVGCPVISIYNPPELTWEAEGKNGTWSFALSAFFHEQSPVGAIVQAIPPSRQRKQPYPSSIRYSFSSLIGSSPAFMVAVSEAQSAARSQLPVLILGESGTGKELLAQSIHSGSQRALGSFIAVNCGAIPKELAASELFGFEGGSFTGSSKDGRAGKFEQADKGTIFLDEIGEMSLDLQTFLLRVLEEHEVVRIGGKKPIQVNVRIIAATNRDLLTDVQNGKFRRDLYYRLNVLSCSVPPLRERQGDIPLLFDHFLQKACSEVGRSRLQVDGGTMRILETYGWPGNVREMRNFAYRLVSKIVGNSIRVEDLPEEIREFRMKPPLVGEKPVISRSSFKDHEIQQIRSMLDELNGNVTEVARRLGMHRSTIYRKLGR